MHSLPLAAAVAAFALCAGAAAQPQPATPAASAAARVGSDSNNGRDMMSPQERDAYREKMLAAPTREECRRMRDEQVTAAARQARNRGIKDVPDPRYDACGD